MFAGGILRVGIFTLIISTTLLAESIPFDYWYGRVVGRTQIQAIHDAFNGETGKLTTSMKVGHDDNVSVNLGKLLEIVPARESNAFELSFHRPDLKADIALGPRLRWHIESLDWIQDVSIVATQYGTDYGKSHRFDSDQSLQLLHKDIEYDSTRSLYFYTSGMYLQPQNWRLDTRLTVEFGASYYDLLDRSAWPWYRPGMDSRVKSDSDWRQARCKCCLWHELSRRTDKLYVLDVTARRGYTENLVLGISGHYKRTTRNEDMSVLEFRISGQDFVDTSVYTRSDKRTGNEARFAFDAQYLLSPSAWFLGSFQYRHDAFVQTHKRDENWPSFESGYEVMHESFGADLDLRFNYFSKTTEVAQQKILDNFVSAQ